jgi:hypothetical protein
MSGSMQRQRRRGGKFLLASLLALGLLGLRGEPPATAQPLDDADTIDFGWASSCPYTRSLQVDPIVSPGKRSAHLHDFFGTTPDENATYETLQAGGTVCALSGDTAGYWAPSLYAPNEAGDPERVVPMVMGVYYLGAPLGAEIDVSPFPPNLKMIAGDAKAEGPQDLRTVWFACGADTRNAASPYLCGQGETVEAHIRFPSCWDGTTPARVGDDSAHMQYPSRGSCPPGWRKVPQLQMFIIYPIRDGRGATLSSGDGPDDPKSIYTLHADYFHAWDQELHSDLVEGCLNDEPEADCGIPHTPAIDHFDPPNAPIGGSVTIRGTNFGGTSLVTFSGRPAAFTLQDMLTIEAVVPPGVQTGIVAVTTDGGTGVDVSTTGYSTTDFVVLDAADSFSRGVAAGWGKADSGLSWNLVGGVATDYFVNGTEGRMKLRQVNSPRLAYLPVLGTDQEILARFGSSKMPKSKRVSAYLVARHDPVRGSFYTVRASLVSDGSVRLDATKMPSSGSEQVLGTEFNAGKIGEATSWYWISAIIQNEGDDVRILAKVWRNDEEEPADWQYSYLDRTSPLTKAGFVGLRAVSQAPDIELEMKFDDFSALVS